MQRTFTQSHRVLRWLSFLLMVCTCLPLMTSCASRKTIVNAIDENEANEILVFLSTKGVDAAKVKNTEGASGGGQKIVLWDISVDSEQATEAMSLLNQAGLPRRRGQNLLSIFSNVGLVPSEMQERIRYQAGLAEQIASTIRKIDGVLDAEVQISFPKEEPLNPAAEKKQKITASVYVKHNGVLDDPNSHLITKIKRLVAASITGLDYDNVTVIGDRARLSESSGGDSQSYNTDQEKQYVTIWTLVLAKDSVTRFRIIFFSFIVLIVLLILTLIWVCWKLFPLLEGHGGFKELLHVRPIALQPHVTPAAVNKESEKEKEDKESDRGIDET